MDRSTTEILLSNLAKLSKHNELSQTKIARRCGLAQKTVNNLFRSETAKISPKVETIDKIAKMFNLTTAELLSPDMIIAEPVEVTKSNTVYNTLGDLIEGFLQLDAMGQAAVVSTAKRESERMQRKIDKQAQFSSVE